LGHLLRVVDGRNAPILAVHGLGSFTRNPSFIQVRFGRHDPVAAQGVRGFELHFSCQKGIRLACAVLR
jgi:hypothetical protein